MSLKPVPGGTQLYLRALSRVDKTLESFGLVCVTGQHMEHHGAHRRYNTCVDVKECMQEY
jgi:hypothetical protein